MLFMINPLFYVLSVLVYWITLSVVSILFLTKKPQSLSGFFLFGIIGNAILLGLGLFNLDVHETLTIPLGIPSFPFTFQWDALSAFFLLLFNICAFGVGFFASYYFQHSMKQGKKLLCCHYHLFLTSIVWVFIAADAFSFLIAWELMALSSYFLIVSVKPEKTIKKAAYLYLLFAHVSALAILVSFIFMLHDKSEWTFSAMRHVEPQIYAELAFGFAIIGFGAKAGLLPLHVWLPEAHPAAPSPVSALMSGVMLKTAIYGLIRVSFDLLANQISPWGIILLAIGLLSALFGVILAAMQTDMKRLLAYSSIENVGIITAAIGLTLIFLTYNQVLLASLALSAALFHSVSHALFKSLLFLGTGNVLHATGERNLGKLGGLIKRMPWVSALMLIGVLATAGIPPLNGFVSEWLLLQAFLFFPPLPEASYITMFIPLSAAAFALVIGLAAYVMVKFYGIIFLGKPRETELRHAQDAHPLEKIGLLWLASACILLGIFPMLLLRAISSVTVSLLGQTEGALYSTSNSLFLIPINLQHASYSPILFLCAIGILFYLLYAVIRLFYSHGIRRGAAWDCGFPAQTPRMQDSAEGFGQPIKQIFSVFLRIKLELPTPFDAIPQYKITTEDRFWYFLYLPLLFIITRCATWISKLQQGRISYYLIYSFLTLLLLLVWVQWR